MNEQQERALTAGLKALAATTKDAGASPRVFDAVMAEMGRAAAGRPTPWFAYAAAAVLFMVSISGAWLARQVERTPEPPIHPRGFVSIPGASALPPIESGAIVRVTLPLTALPQYGLAIVPEAATEMVDAELLVAQDGLPRAIRLATGSRETRSSP